ncbi:MAG: hypothetical protein ACI4VL_03610 [Bacilli bacterium]
MSDEPFRLSLIEIMNKDLLNDFVNDIFDYNLKKDEYVYIQYKIVNGNIILNIFDNSEDNRFKAYIFTDYDTETQDDDIIYVNVETCYQEYKNGNKKKLILLGALLKSGNKEEKKEIIKSLFDNDIKNILIDNFI